MPATPTTTRRRVPTRARRLARLREGAGELLLLVPILVAIGVAVVVPSVSVVRHAFTDWDPGYPSPWVGLDNFRVLLESDTFRQILLNHGVLLLGVPLWVAAPLVMAFLLYTRVPAPGLWRAIMFFPAVAPPAVVGILFAVLLAPDGPLNSALQAVGLGGLTRDWLSDPHLVKPTLIVILAWATMGMGVVIYSAALTAVPPELFESAEIDGAGWWQRLWHIVLPGIRRTVELWTTLLVVTVFVAIFPWIYTLTRGGPGYSSTTIDWDIYQNALAYGDFGLAAAEALLLLALVAFVAMLGMLISRKAART